MPRHARRAAAAGNEQVLETDRLIRANARSTEVGRRLMEIPGVGPLLASALVGTIADPGALRPAAISRRGSASFRSRTPAAAKSGWAGSPSRATDTCARCSSSAPWRSCVTP